MTAIDLDALARHLGVPYSQLRTTGSKVILIAGSRGNVKSIGQHLVIAIRDSAIGKEVELRQTLIDCGLLNLVGDALVVERIPDEGEARALRMLLGLHRASRAA